MRQLDPALAAYLARIPPSDIAKLTPRMFRGVLRAAALARPVETRPPVAAIEDVSLPGAAGPLAARLYRPDEGPCPTLVFFHGGGWVAGDIETHDVIARLIARLARTVVVSVTYRQPPEAPFPAAFHDAFAAIRAVHRRPPGGTDRIAVGGDSAGGNLAAAVALACRDQGLPLAAQLLLYPIADVAGHYRDPAINALYPSRADNASGYLLTLDLMGWFAEAYVGQTEAVDWRASPMRALNVGGVAPAIVATASFDPLRDEGQAYVARLAEAGVGVRSHTGEGLIHGYFGMTDVSEPARAEVERVCADLKLVLAGASPSAIPRKPR